MKEIKKEIISSVRTCSDECLLQQVNGILNQKKINKEIILLLEKKGFNSKEMESVIRYMIGHCNVSPKRKINFLREIRRRGIILEEKITKPGEYQNLRDLLHTNYKDICDDEFLISIINWVPQISQSSIGKGEIFFFILGEHSRQGKRGDLVIKNTEIEIKARLSRMLGTTGYSSPPTVYHHYFYPELKKKFKNVSEDPNEYNFNNKGLSNLFGLYDSLDDKKWAVSHLTSTFKKLYYDAPSKMIENFINEVFKGSLSVESFQKEFIGLQFDYYKYKDGWKGILFLNPKNFNILYLTTSKMLKNHLKEFTVQKSFSWKEDRCVTYQLSLR